MDENKWVYFIATSPFIELAEAEHRRLKDTQDECQRWKEALGARSLVTRGTFIVGFTLEEGASIPPELRLHKTLTRWAGFDVYTPNRGTKGETKKRVKEINAALTRSCSAHDSHKNHRDVAQLCGITLNDFGTIRPGLPHRGGGSIVLFAGFEKVGDTWLVRIPLTDQKKPSMTPDGRRLKTSEYFQLKEEVEEACA